MGDDNTQDPNKPMEQREPNARMRGGTTEPAAPNAPADTTPPVADAPAAEMPAEPTGTTEPAAPATDMPAATPDAGMPEEKKDPASDEGAM